MPQVTEAELKRNIKDKKFNRIYFLFGEEKYLVKYYSDKLCQAVLGKNYIDFNYSLFNENNIKIDDISDAVEALPMMAETKLVRVNDLDIEALNSQDLKKLEQLISDIPDSTVLLISQGTLNINAKKSSKWKKFIDYFEKFGLVANINKMSIISLEKQLVVWADKMHTRLSQNNANKIINICGDDLFTLRNEIEKLCAFARDGEINESDIDAVVTRNLETTVFVLSNAIISANYNKAYKQLDLLLYQKEEPVAILAVLASAYIDLYRVRACIESGEKISLLTKSFDYKNKEFRLRNAEKDSKNLSMELIKNSLNEILKADRLLKSSRVDSYIIMQELITKLMLISRKDRYH